MFKVIHNKENLGPLTNCELLTIDEIAYVNTLLKNQINMNISIMDRKRKEEDDLIKATEFSKLLTKSRKVFAFKINIEGPKSFEDYQIIYNYINKLVENQDSKTTKLFNINEYVYMKSQKNILLECYRYILTEKLTIEQIDPKSLLKELESNKTK